MKKIKCWLFGHLPPSVSVADGIGGLNRYFLKECPRCGGQWWDRMGIPPHSSPECEHHFEMLRVGGSPVELGSEEIVSICKYCGEESKDGL